MCRRAVKHKHNNNFVFHFPASFGHDSMVKPHCSNFRITTAIFFGSPNFLDCYGIWPNVWRGFSHEMANEPPHDKTNKMACVPSEDSDQPGHLPNPIRILKKAWLLNNPLSAQQRLWSDWNDAQSDLSLRWVHSYLVGFVKWWLNIFSSSWEEEAEGAWEIAERERKTAERRTDEVKTRFQNAPDNGGGYHCCGYFLQRYR